MNTCGYWLVWPVLAAEKQAFCVRPHFQWFLRVWAEEDKKLELIESRALAKPFSTNACQEAPFVTFLFAGSSPPF